MCTCCRPNSQGGKPARTQRKLEENVWGRGIRTSAPLVPERRSNVDSITYNPDRGATDGSGHPSHLLHFKRSALKSFSASIQFTYVGTRSALRMNGWMSRGKSEPSYTNTSAPIRAVLFRRFESRGNRRPTAPDFHGAWTESSFPVYSTTLSD